MKILIILSLLCINNASPTQPAPSRNKKPAVVKKAVKKASLRLAPSIIIVN